MPTVLNAANEAAVAAFLEGKISFLEIENIVEKMLSSHQPVSNPDLETIQEIDQKTREDVGILIP